jgi:tetratricopeptide (TPR) repeat protein
MAAIYRDGAVTSLPLPADSAVFAAAAGSEDSLWLADAAKGSLTAWTADGRIRDIVYPELQAGQTLMRLKTLPDGGFLAATNQAVARFDRFGRLIWNWDGAAEGIPLNLSTYTDLAVGSGGIVYLSDYLGKRVLRLAEPGSRLPEGLAAVAAAGAAFRAAPSRAELLLPLARAYEKMGAVEAARATLARYLEERPADAAEADRLQGLEASLLKLRAASAKADALALLGRYGPETGREAYARAMRTYESLRVRLPDDRELAQSLAELRSAFQKADSASVSALPTPQVAGVELAALFPSLLNAYRSKPAGYITIRNGGNEAFRELRAELFIAKYMDFPSIGPVVARLEAGKELRLELSAFLNEAALEVQEDLPLQARISLHFTDSKGTRSLELTRPVVLYRRTALTWDETGKLAAFVTPNEETIARAAFALMGGATERPLVSTSFGRALAISDALGSLPLRYVPDPQSPVTAILGNSTVVDTVRFPRTTLSYQGGDCDDTTALLCSLLEASGIATAILTTPGHVFLAFDSGEREEAAWLFQAAGYRVIAREGRVWIPLESTLLAKGFAAAWKEASELVRKEEGGKDFEFLPLASLRQAYPSLPLPPSSLPLILPDAEARAALDRAVAASLGQELMGPVAAAIEATRTQATGKEWSRQSNRLAQLYARWNQGERAATLWKEILRRDPAYVAAYLNLANLGLQAGKREEALAWLGKAEAAAPGSTSVADWATRTGLSSALAAGGGGTAAARAPLAQSASGGASDPAGGAGRAAGATAIVWEGD